MLGQPFASSALSGIMCCWSPGTSSSGRIALTGHSGMQTAQSMHSSGSIARKFGPSRKQSTGHTSTQSVYLQRIQASVTTWVMATGLLVALVGDRKTGFYGGDGSPDAEADAAEGVSAARGVAATVATPGSAVAPTPTITTVGRPPCSTTASGSVSTQCSLPLQSGQPARETTATGVSPGQPAPSRRLLSAASWRPAM